MRPALGAELAVANLRPIHAPKPGDFHFPANQALQLVT
jgi:hypothetical protein